MNLVRNVLKELRRESQPTGYPVLTWGSPPVSRSSRQSSAAQRTCEYQWWSAPGIWEAWVGWWEDRPASATGHAWFPSDWHVSPALAPTCAREVCKHAVQLTAIQVFTVEWLTSTGPRFNLKNEHPFLTSYTSSTMHYNYECSSTKKPILFSTYQTLTFWDDSLLF